MKLGRLLLSRFNKKRSSRVAPATQKRPKRIRSKKRSFLSVGTSARNVRTTEPKKHPAPSPIEQAASVAPVSQQPVVQVQQPQILEQESSRGGPLTTADLIRPDGNLTRSIEAFLLDQRSPHTQRAYGKDLRRFVQFLAARKAHRGLEGIDRSVLIAYKDSLLAEELEHTTIDRHLATLRSFFRWLVDDDLIAKNPAEGVRFMNPKRVSRTQAFTDEEVQKLLSKPNLHTRIGSQHFAILTILFYCGLRRSEVCDLRTSQLGEEHGHPVVRLRGKGNAERVIVLTRPVVKALQHYFLITGKSPAKDGYLFSPIRNNRTGVREKRMDPSMIFYIVTRYAKLAGIQNRVSPHSCRATAISNARDHQVPDRAIQEFAGWASPDMITRYDKRKTSVEKSAAHAIRYGNEDRALPKVRVETHEPQPEREVRWKDPETVFER